MTDRFEARVPAKPGERFAVHVAEDVRAVTVVTASGRRVQGEVVAAHSDDTGDLHVTIEVPDGVLPPLDPGSFSAGPVADTPPD